MKDLYRMTYNPSVVCLSFGIAFLGSYLTITFCYLLRLVQKGAFSLKILNKYGVLFCMACALGGIGIWCMHFVGMSSLKLYDPMGNRTNVQYRLFPTILSLVFVILFSGAGLYIASLDIMFGKSKEQIVEIYKNEARHMSLHEIRHTSNFKMLRIISTHSLYHLVIGGCIAGSGISVMHYLGMWGMLFSNGRIVWNVGIIAASILIAIIASIAAFWILFRFLSLYPHMELLRIASSFIMAVAVCGMHYTGMAAATFKYEVGASPSLIAAGLEYYVEDSHAFQVVIITAVILGGILVMLAFMELRHWIYCISIEHKHCCQVLEQVSTTNYDHLSSVLHPATMRKITSTRQVVSPRRIVASNSPLESVVEKQSRTQSTGTEFANGSMPNLHVEDVDD